MIRIFLKFFCGAGLLCFLASTLPAQEWAKARLEKSPRHGEWVTIKAGDGDRELKAFVVYPEVAGKVPAVLVIHEIFGLTDWIRGVCDQLAEAGYVAIAPDMLSGQTYAGIDEARKAISQLKPEQIRSDLNAGIGYVRGLPAVNGKVAVAGFCWGGGEAFRLASNTPGLSAVFPFYGTSPQQESEVRGITAPLYGFFAENDARITAGLPASEELLKAAGKKHEFVTYPGAGHGFMRAGEAPDASPENKKARDQAWERWKKLLKELP